MANYMMKYKSVYRLLPELCTDTNDFPRTQDGGIDPDTEIYIACQHGMKITYWGLNESRKGVLTAYIPSKTRGRNICKALKKQGIKYTNYDETDEEVLFNFLASDIEPVAEIMKARTSGANISPFSTKNLPKNKSVVIPDEEMAKYKEVSSKVGKNDMLLFKNLNEKFLASMQRKIRKNTEDRQFDIKQDMKKEKLSRQVKEYIYMRGFWTEYLKYLSKNIDAYYNS
jgi:hypothetical protein